MTDRISIPALREYGERWVTLAEAVYVMDHLAALVDAVEALTYYADLHASPETWTEDWGQVARDALARFDFGEET